MRWDRLGPIPSGTDNEVFGCDLHHVGKGGIAVSGGSRDSLEPGRNRAVNNVVHHNGNCGIAPWSTESRGRIVNNIVTQNGWRDQWVCPCVGIWNYGDWAKWRFANNIVFGNRDGD